jgi:hypothetical protein
MPIFEEGLGIRNLLRFNHALLGKCLRHYGLKREASSHTRFEVGDGSKVRKPFQVYLVLRAQRMLLLWIT